METATDLHVPISIDLGSGAYLGREIMRQVIERYNATVPVPQPQRGGDAGTRRSRTSRQATSGLDHERARSRRGCDPRGTRRSGTQRRGAFHCSARQVVVRDTTGAGDAMAAGFLLSLTRGSPLRACADYGCEVAAETVQVLGGLPANDNL